MSRAENALAKRAERGEDPSANWQTFDTYTLPTGKTLEVGTEVSVTGERGRFKFMQYVRTDKDVEWIDVVGGTPKVREWRSFRPERITKVHRTKTIISDEEMRKTVNQKNRLKRTGQ